MDSTRRIRLTESDWMEGGINCPNCNRYLPFGDIVAVGRCDGRVRPGETCRTELALDLVLG
ncbi:hypothetical protein AUR64_00865 [Haloprofundus marisrubri]|uniref:Uncharacterized protein n=1 Tax=Haloprofundus marisrubri TaxID=1514971 RepID=A0A0W1R457_9EURY|nr:hypothetical protein [Haloprofundus marisrubri]KTG08158.1 hypothetical protein AUR64_00865 [Haloprofundus marisrubri]